MTLLLKTKTILIDGYHVTVYSVDGRTWTSRARDALAYRARYARERVEIRKVFDAINTSTGARKIVY